MIDERTAPTGTSSAEPDALARYSTDGIALAMALQAAAAALGGAADALAGTGVTLAGLGDLVVALTDLAADWYHLDEFAGDVAAGFVAARGAGAAPGTAPLVTTVADRTLAEAGRVGVADRDRAIARAERLAATYRRMLDDLANGQPLVHDPPAAGGRAPAEVERLAARAEALRHDPAFAVAFVEAMGVNGLVALRGLLRSYAGEAREVGRPHGHDWSETGTAGWVEARMAGIAGVLTTAMDTRRATAGRLDGGTAGLGPGARLSERWVTRFERYRGGAQHDHSLLVLEADLPADVVVATGDASLGEHLGEPPDGRERRPGEGGGLASGAPAVTDADRNLAAAIAADPDASLGWLASDGIAPGTATVELILTRRLPAELHGALVGVVESALTHPGDEAGRAELMELAVRLVGEPRGGGVAAPWGSGGEPGGGAAAMRRALGRGAAANLAVVDDLVTGGWRDPHLGTPPPGDAYVAHDFLREVMVDAQAADAVAGGYESYALDRLRHLPPRSPGDPDGRLDARDAALRRLGAIEGVVIRAESNAVLGSIEQRIARQRGRAGLVDAGVEGAAFAAGFLPVSGLAVGAVDSAADLAGVSAGDFAFPADFAELAEAEQESVANGIDAQVNLAALLAVAEHPEDAPARPPGGFDGRGRRRFIDWVGAHHDADDHAHLLAGYGFADRFEYRR